MCTRRGTTLRWRRGSTPGGRATRRGASRSSRACPGRSSTGTPRSTGPTARPSGSTSASPRAEFLQWSQPQKRLYASVHRNFATTAQPPVLYRGLAAASSFSNVAPGSSTPSRRFRSNGHPRRLFFFFFLVFQQPLNCACSPLAVTCGGGGGETRKETSGKQQSRGQRGRRLQGLGQGAAEPSEAATEGASGAAAAERLAG